MWKLDNNVFLRLLTRSYYAMTDCSCVRVWLHRHWLGLRCLSLSLVSGWGRVVWVWRGGADGGTLGRHLPVAAVVGGARVDDHVALGGAQVRAEPHEEVGQPQHVVREVRQQEDPRRVKIPVPFIMIR